MFGIELEFVEEGADESLGLGEGVVALPVSAEKQLAHSIGSLILC